VDPHDRVILNAVQQNLPLTPRPYDVLGRELDLPEDEVHRRVVALRETGTIRRLGPLFSARKLGRRGHLVAARVRDDAVERVAGLLDAHDEVTHNYLRSGPLNVWFTVMLDEEDDLERILAEVRSCEGVSAVETFTSLRTFKLDASFRVGVCADG